MRVLLKTFSVSKKDRNKKELSTCSRFFRSPPLIFAVPLFQHFGISIAPRVPFGTIVATFMPVRFLVCDAFCAAISLQLVEEHFSLFLTNAPLATRNRHSQTQG